MRKKSSKWAGAMRQVRQTETDHGGIGGGHDFLKR